MIHRGLMNDACTSSPIRMYDSSYRELKAARVHQRGAGLWTLGAGGCGLWPEKAQVGPQARWRDARSADPHRSLPRRFRAAQRSQIAGWQATVIVTPLFFACLNTLFGFRNGTEPAYRLNVDAKEHWLNRQFAGVFTPLRKRISPPIGVVCE